MLSASMQRGLMWVAGGLLIAFLALPLWSLFAISDWEELTAGLGHRLVAPALALSLGTSAISLLFILVLGTPLAWRLAHSRSRAASLTETFLQLPIVLPPAVAGLGLLLAFGREGLITRLIGPWPGLSSSTLAVILAQIFVAAPFYLSAATGAFRQIDRDLIHTARTFGASPWRVFSRLGVPLAFRALCAGAAMCWARALGEFGATLMFAGNLEGRTQTMPLAIYTALDSDTRVAQALSVVLVLFALAVLLIMRYAMKRALPEGR